jgi:hypothetical protein
MIKFKPEDMSKILAVFEELSLGKLDIQLHSTDGPFFSFKDGIKGPFDELMIRTFTCALNTVLHEKEEIAIQNKTASESKPVALLPAPVEKPAKISIKGNHIIWENISKIRQ